MEKIQEAVEEDYMADISTFLPPEQSQPTLKKVQKRAQVLDSSLKKKDAKIQNWQDRRKINREQKQREEDQQTLANINAAIPSSNIGFKMLKQMGYKPGSALGKDGSGLAEPVGLEIRRSRAGIGREDPLKEKERVDEYRNHRKRKKEENLMIEFGSRQKLQWRSRRVVSDYYKAKAALEQLENKEIVVTEKDNDEDSTDKEEEEEEQITEEDLEEILMQLREHRYCLYCGFQYESVEALLSNCPGLTEEDH